MQNYLERKTTISPNTSEAVDRIVLKAVRDIEGADDKLWVVEVARRKFLMLFEEESDQYMEAHARLVRATESHLFAQIMQSVDESESTVDDSIASSLELDRLVGVFPVILGKAQSIEELDLAFNECEGHINRFSTSERTRFPLLKKVELRIRLVFSYEARKTELEG